MIFWILITLTVLITAGVFVSQLDQGYMGAPFMLSFLSLIACTIVGGLIFIACGSWIPWNVDLVRDDTHHLKALGNNSSIEGRMYFLGGGYVKDKRVLNFISQQDNGAIHIEQADADKATIFEGNKDATVQVKHYDNVNGWVSPWPLGSHDEYTFRIPTGSVVESYTLDNSK